MLRRFKYPPWLKAKKIKRGRDLERAQSSYFSQTINTGAVSGKTVLTEGRKSTKIKKKAVWTGLGRGRVVRRFIGRGGGSIGRQNLGGGGILGKSQGVGQYGEFQKGGGGGGL